MAMLSTKATSEKTGIPQSTLRYWRSIGVGPAYHILSPTGKAGYRYDDRDIETYVQARRYDPSARADLERVHANR